MEIRNLPQELSLKENKINAKNVFYVNDNLLLIGSFKEILEISSTLTKVEKLKSEINKTIKKFENNDKLSYEIAGRSFDFNYAYVMGILNVTPDSFSDGGKYTDKTKAIEYAIEMIETGADIIDIGGESTRPGSESVSEAEEMKRVIPVIDEILKRMPDTIISIDTTKAKIAEEALKCGASIVNDISGGTFDSDIFNITKDFNAGIVIMHIKNKPKTMQVSPEYSEVVSEVYDYLARQTELAYGIGVKNIFIDPGIGFGKRIEDNLKLIERLEDFKSLGFPILIGFSRKSFIGNILNLPVEDRDDVTNSLNSIALSRGARIIRTHNVKHAVQTCKIYNRLISN